MVVGICRIVLALPWNDSLKGKRSVVKSILERARQRFHVAAAEVDDLDQHRRATLGFAVVSNDARHAQSVLDKVVSFAAGATQAQVVDRTIEIEHYELGAGLGAFGEDHFDPPEWEDDDGDEQEDGDEKGDGKRSQKIGEALRGELMNLLLAGEVHDPGVQNVVVSGVEIGDDLKIAKVYVRLMDIGADAKAQKALIDALYRAKGFLRREVAHRSNLRYAPELRFFWDESIDRGREMEALLREIKPSDSGPKE